jgi:hypothetical protein
MTSTAGKPPLPTGLLVVTILVILQVLVRAGFLINSVTRNAQFLSNPTLLIQSVIIPLILMALTAVMIALIFSRAPAAKPYGITVCCLNLAFQLYAIGSFVFIVLSNPNLPIAQNFPVPFAVLSTAFIAVFALELIMLARWQPKSLLIAQRPPSPEGVYPSQRGGNYFARHWRGELSLPRSYWLNGALIFGLGCNLLFIAAFAATVALVRSSTGLAIFLLLCVQALDIAGYVWALVGTWRAAGHYQGPRFWAILARIGMSLGVLVSIAHVTQNLSLIARISDLTRY